MYIRVVAILAPLLYYVFPKQRMGFLLVRKAMGWYPLGLLHADFYLSVRWPRRCPVVSKANT